MEYFSHVTLDTLRRNVNRRVTLCLSTGSEVTGVLISFLGKQYLFINDTHERVETYIPNYPRRGCVYMRGLCVIVGRYIDRMCFGRYIPPLIRAPPMMLPTDIPSMNYPPIIPQTNQAHFMPQMVHYETGEFVDNSPTAQQQFVVQYPSFGRQFESFFHWDTFFPPHVQLHSNEDRYISLNVMQSNINRLVCVTLEGRTVLYGILVQSYALNYFKLSHISQHSAVSGNSPESYNWQLFTIGDAVIHMNAVVSLSFAVEVFYNYEEQQPTEQSCPETYCENLQNSMNFNVSESQINVSSISHSNIVSSSTQINDISVSEPVSIDDSQQLQTVDSNISGLHSVTDSESCGIYSNILDPQPAISTVATRDSANLPAVVYANLFNSPICSPREVLSVHSPQVGINKITFSQSQSGLRETMPVYSHQFSPDQTIQTTQSLNVSMSGTVTHHSVELKQPMTEDLNISPKVITETEAVASSTSFGDSLDRDAFPPLNKHGRKYFRRCFVPSKKVSYAAAAESKLKTTTLTVTTTSFVTTTSTLPTVTKKLPVTTTSLETKSQTVPQTKILATTTSTLSETTMIKTQKKIIKTTTSPVNNRTSTKTTTIKTPREVTETEPLPITTTISPITTVIKTSQTVRDTALQKKSETIASTNIKDSASTIGETSLSRKPFRSQTKKKRQSKIKKEKASTVEQVLTIKRKVDEHKPNQEDELETSVEITKSSPIKSTPQGASQIKQTQSPKKTKPTAILKRSVVEEQPIVCQAQESKEEIATSDTYKTCSFSVPLKPILEKLQKPTEGGFKSEYKRDVSVVTLVPENETVTETSRNLAETYEISLITAETCAILSQLESLTNNREVNTLECLMEVSKPAKVSIEVSEHALITDEETVDKNLIEIEKKVEPTVVIRVPIEKYKATKELLPEKHLETLVEAMEFYSSRSLSEEPNVQIIEKNKSNKSKTDPDVSLRETGSERDVELTKTAKKRAKKVSKDRRKRIQEENKSDDIYSEWIRFNKNFETATKKALLSVIPEEAHLIADEEVGGELFEMDSELSSIREQLNLVKQELDAAYQYSSMDIEDTVQQLQPSELKGQEIDEPTKSSANSKNKKRETKEKQTTTTDSKQTTEMSKQQLSHLETLVSGMEDVVDILSKSKKKRLLRKKKKQHDRSPSETSENVASIPERKVDLHLVAYYNYPCIKEKQITLKLLKKNLNKPICVFFKSGLNVLGVLVKVEGLRSIVVANPNIAQADNIFFKNDVLASFNLIPKDEMLVLMNTVEYVCFRDEFSEEGSSSTSSVQRIVSVSLTTDETVTDLRRTERELALQLRPDVGRVTKSYRTSKKSKHSDTPPGGDADDGN